MSSNKIFVAIACLMLAGCVREQTETSQALDTAGTETESSYNKLRNELGLGHKPKPVKATTNDPRYCYKTYEDVICYATPLPGEEYRLVGYQTAAGKTGYTLPPAQVRNSQADTLPPLKSVDVGPPPAVKADNDKDGKQLKEIIFDPEELQPKELVPDKQQ